MEETWNMSGSSSARVTSGSHLLPTGFGEAPYQAVNYQSKY